MPIPAAVPAAVAIDFQARRDHASATSTPSGNPISVGFTHGTSAKSTADSASTFFAFSERTSPHAASAHAIESGRPTVAKFASTQEPAT